ncbi:MAG: hypothetical protein RIR33_387 [Pseudomonadota bacterium]|jgi:hypothetical protein
MNETYRTQIRLLLDVLPLVAEEHDFALKGGTAINLFVRDLPRLSVDIDLTYLPLDDRDTAFHKIAEALRRIKARIEAISGSRTTLVDQGGGMEVKLQVQRGRTRITIEVNPTLRGHLMPVRVLPTVPRVEEQFEAFVEMSVVAHGELFGGKLCAALDRQHPRDLFDVRGLLDAEGITDEVRHGLIAGLVGHNRPISELIAGRMQDREAAFNAEFAGMTLAPFDYPAHAETYRQMIDAIHRELTADDKAFLLSFEAGAPAWNRFPYADLAGLPGVQWKLMNIQKLQRANPAKHQQGIDALRRVLGA